MVVLKESWAHKVTDWAALASLLAFMGYGFWLSIAPDAEASVWSSGARLLPGFMIASLVLAVRYGSVVRREIIVDTHEIVLKDRIPAISLKRAEVCDVEVADTGDAVCIGLNDRPLVRVRATPFQLTPAELKIWLASNPG
ncbi:hypothetical protein [Maricaulis sp.]|uniref:hypothetical protein n=1 Tax=Maricaulis sp. TaxID=1486257 RepID=UPI002B26F387|nr:hypothetical protein [Maricaulis sp.]